MLDQDISTEDALRLLTRPAPEDEVGPGGWTRRRFLQTVGMGAAAGMSIGTFAGDVLGFDIPEAWAGTPLGPTQGVLVVINLLGGVDGLNMVVPYTNSLYYSQRPSVAIAAADVLSLDATFGLHPNLGYLRSLWQVGQLAIVHGVGNPGADLSHFTSMASWFAGRYGSLPPSTGWVGRWLDGLPGDLGDSSALAVGTGVSLQLIGAQRRGLAVPPNGSLFGASQEAADVRMYNGIRSMAAPAGRGFWHEQHARVAVKHLDLARDVAPVLQPAATGSELVRKLTVAARLINADLGFRVLDVSLGGFDTHDNQPGKLAGLLQQLNDGLQAFFATLAPAFRSRVALMTLSEFGRTGFANGSLGTDHGTSNVMMVIGPNVRGGHYGAPSSLEVRNRWERMVPTTDFRNVLGTCIDRWLGGGASTVLNGAHADMNFFRSAPGDPPPTQPPIIVQLPTVPCVLTPLTPDRSFDTRRGIGGRSVPLAAGQTWNVQIAGRNGVPADATAVVLNLTGVNATAPTFVSAWPTGRSRPSTSTLNLVPGPPAANLAIVPLGADGQISLFNNAGSTHLVGDVTGYLKAGTGTGVVALTPDRLLDTRTGLGGRTGPLAGGTSFDLQVTGRGGVAANATAVFVNVTAVRPTAQTFVSVYPTGAARPGSSSLNVGAGDVRPNLVLCPIGTGGRITLFNNAGMADVVVDVLGAVVPAAAGRYVALAPDRILDTRSGLNAPAAKVAQQPLVVPVLGKGGIPSSKVHAVVLNVTGVRPSATTFVTVWPTGSPRPTASNLNVPAGVARPNVVVVRPGPDGSVQLYNNSGVIDLVADVLGYVTG